MTVALSLQGPGGDVAAGLTLTTGKIMVDEINVTDAAIIIGCCPRRVRVHIASGRLHARRLMIQSRCIYLIKRKDAEAFKPLPVGNPNWKRKGDAQ